MGATKNIHNQPDKISSMPYISLPSAVTLTDLSERTLRRRLAEGLIVKVNSEDSHKTLISLASIRSDFCLPFEAEQLELIQCADQGDAKAQNDLALFFLDNNKPKSALYWLELAIKQNIVDAMYLMGCCYLNGNGLPKDANLAIMWIAKAAAAGHPIALAQMQSIYPKIAEEYQR